MSSSSARRSRGGYRGDRARRRHPRRARRAEAHRARAQHARRHREPARLSRGAGRLLSRHRERCPRTAAPARSAIRCASSIPRTRATSAINAEAPSFADYLTPRRATSSTRSRRARPRSASPIAINPRLVRGLDYYCHTAFEFVTTDLGAQGTVLGGGRYDGLMGVMGGPRPRASAGRPASSVWRC